MAVWQIVPEYHVFCALLLHPCLQHRLIKQFVQSFADQPAVLNQYCTILGECRARSAKFCMSANTRTLILAPDAARARAGGVEIQPSSPPKHPHCRGGPPSRDFASNP